MQCTVAHRARWSGDLYRLDSGARSVGRALELGGGSSGEEEPLEGRLVHKGREIKAPWLAVVLVCPLPIPDPASESESYLR